MSNMKPCNVSSKSRKNGTGLFVHVFLNKQTSPRHEIMALGLIWPQFVSYISSMSG